VLGVAVLYTFIRPPFGLYGTRWIFIIGYLFIVLPYALRAQQGSLVGISGSLFEASRVSGGGYIGTIWNIALPLMRRGIAAGATLGLVLLSHDFSVSVMLRTAGSNVMGTLLYEYWENGGYAAVAVMAVIMSVVTSVILGLTLWIGGRSALKSL
jgi:iron(III) transport system permease protein